LSTHINDKFLPIIQLKAINLFYRHSIMTKGVTTYEGTIERQGDTIEMHDNRKFGRLRRFNMTIGRKVLVPFALDSLLLKDIDLVNCEAAKVCTLLRDAIEPPYRNRILTDTAFAIQYVGWQQRDHSEGCELIFVWDIDSEPRIRRSTPIKKYR
jgi:hypothetical protein